FRRVLFRSKDPVPVASRSDSEVNDRGTQDDGFERAVEPGVSPTMNRAIRGQDPVAVAAGRGSHGDDMVAYLLGVQPGRVARRWLSLGGLEAVGQLLHNS